MIVTFDKDILNDAVTPAMSAVSGKNTHKEIEGIRITANADGTCVLNSFDLEKGITCTVRGDVEQPGSFIINGQKLSQIIRNMPENIRIEVDKKNNQAKLTSGKSEFTISALPGEDFPNTPALEGDWSFKIPQCELRDAITKTLYAVASNEPRPALNGMLFRVRNQSIVLAATDSFRLAVCEKEMPLQNENGDSPLDLSMVVPGKTVTELLKMLSDTNAPVTIMATRKHIIFSLGWLTFFSRLIDAEFVDYEKFMPKNPCVFVSVKTAELRSSLERASLVTEDHIAGQAKSYVKFLFEGDILKVSAVSMSGTSYDEIPVSKEGADLHIGFSCRYLLDALRTCDTEYIRIAMVSQLVSIVITPDESRLSEDEIAAKEKKQKETGVLDEKFMHLVVPLHMKE